MTVSYLKEFGNVENDGKKHDKGHVSLEFPVIKVVVTSTYETNPDISLPRHDNGAVHGRHQCNLHQGQKVFGPIGMVVRLVFWPNHWQSPQHATEYYYLKWKIRLQFVITFFVHVLKRLPSSKTSWRKIGIHSRFSICQCKPCKALFENRT